MVTKHKRKLTNNARNVTRKRPTSWDIYPETVPELLDVTVVDSLRRLGYKKKIMKPPVNIPDATEKPDPKALIALERLEKRFGLEAMKLLYVARASANVGALKRGMETPERPRKPGLKSAVPKLSAEQIDSLWDREKWVSAAGRTETPPDFIKRVFCDLLGNGLVLSDLRRRHPKTHERVDEPLYQSLFRWQRTNALPDDFDLPRRAEVTDRLAGAIDEDPSKVDRATKQAVSIALALRNARLVR